MRHSLSSFKILSCCLALSFTLASCTDDTAIDTGSSDTAIGGEDTGLFLTDVAGQDVSPGTDVAIGNELTAIPDADF